MASIKPIVYDKLIDGKLAVDQLYVLCDNKFYKLSDIYYYSAKDAAASGADKKKRKISSVKDFNNLPSGTVFYMPPTGAVRARLNRKLYPASIVDVVVDNKSASTKPLADSSGTLPLPIGASADFWDNLDGNERTIKFTPEAWASSGDAFVLVRLEGSSKFEMVKKSELEVFVAGEEPKILKDLGVSDLSDKTITLSREKMIL